MTVIEKSAEIYCTGCDRQLLQMPYSQEFVHKDNKQPICEGAEVRYDYPSVA